MALMYSQAGPVNMHIKESLGGSTNPFNHYSTTYNLKYGKHWVNRELYREPQPGGNFMWSKRCHIGYRSTLDDFDNPFIKPIIKTNYLSVTKRDFSTPILKHRECRLADINNLILPPGYNFHTELTIPKNMHNPDDWKTTYNTEHNFKVPNPVDFHRDPIGNKELSGFTLNSPIIDTLSFRPHSTYKNDWPRTETNRPTGQTMYSTDYRKYSVPDGSEPLPEIPYGSDRSSGFVKGNQQRPDFVPSSREIFQPKKVYSPKELEKLKKTDPAEYVENAYPYPEPSITHGINTDPLSKPLTEEEVLGRVKVGDKERTGFVANQINYIQTKDDPGRFITHNMTKYYNPMLIGYELNGHVSFNVNEIEPDGFVKNNGVSNFESNLSTFTDCTEMDNYQIRSYNIRDYVAR